MKFLGLIDHPLTIVVAQGVPPQCLLLALLVIAKPIAVAILAQAISVQDGIAL